MKVKKRKKSKLPLEEQKKIKNLAMTLAITTLIDGSWVVDTWEYDFTFKESTEQGLGNFLQDRNGKWQKYDEIVEVTYENKKVGNKKVLIMGLEDEKENQRVFHSMTEPLFYLVENEIGDYVLQTTGFSTEEARKEYTSEQRVIDVVSINKREEWSFEEIAEKEQLKEKQLNGKNIATLPSPFSEDCQTLLKYNSWFYQTGSDKELTKEDFAIIESNTNAQKSNDGILSIKLQNNEYAQVSNDYLVVQSEEGRLELISGFGNEYNLFVGNKRKMLDYTILGSLGEYIEENNIESIGYTTQLWSAWGDNDVEFIRQTYGEDVLECLKENGFPLPCYDVNDFYKTYENDLASTIVRTRKRQN